MSNEARPDPISNRQFGLILGLVTATFGMWPLLHSDEPRRWLLVLSALLVVPGLFFPSVLTIPKKGWLKVAGGIAAVVNFVLISILFYGVFTPVALLFRVVGRDVLGLRFDAKASSYWKSRSGSESTDFNRPF